MTDWLNSQEVSQVKIYISSTLWRTETDYGMLRSE